MLSQILVQKLKRMYTCDSFSNFVFLQAYVSRKHESDKVIVYERAGVVFAFNFHPSQSYTDYKIGVGEAGTYPLLNTAFNITEQF